MGNSKVENLVCVCGHKVTDHGNWGCEECGCEADPVLAIEYAFEKVKGYLAQDFNEFIDEE